MSGPCGQMVMRARAESFTIRPAIREQGTTARRPRVQLPSTHQLVEQDHRGSAEKYTACQAGVRLDESAGQAAPGDLLVDSVGLHMLVKVVCDRCSKSQPPKAAGIFGIRYRARHLVDRQMPANRAPVPPVPPVKAEERHHIHRSERDGGDYIDVGSEAALEPQALQSPGKQLGMRSSGDSAAVLVSLDFHQGRLGPPG